ncbi:hypothetical protein Q21_gp53 [Vibrio phage VPp1]|nr:hypothetical protein Q21_gp53 [Vibrio phage VPp1]
MQHKPNKRKKKKPFPEQQLGKNKMRITADLKVKDVRIRFGNITVDVNRNNFAKVVQALK